MKIRQGFVSNSSSSSFVINRSDLTQEQVDQIVDHTESETYEKHVGDLRKWAKKNKNCVSDDSGTYDEWEIAVTEDTVKGKTPMDNFDMHAFLEDELKIGPSKIEWAHSNDMWSEKKK